MRQILGVFAPANEDRSQVASGQLDRSRHLVGPHPGGRGSNAILARRHPPCIRHREAANASSLMIGFLAGVAAGLALGLDKLLVLDSGGLQVMLGIAAAGYAGTDFIEAFAPSVSAAQIPPLPRLTTGAVQPQGVAPIVMNTATLPQTSTSATSTNAADTKYGASFGSLVPNGFFSSDPGDLKVPIGGLTPAAYAATFTHAAHAAATLRTPLITG